MTTPEIQEMLEGMLNDEQTSEILHRMSVSPEKLTEFRQHMALRGAMERDARSEAISDEEDDAVWAAVLGATGGLVTGGAASAGGWLARGAAFVATGLAGFFIGTAVDNASDDEATAIADAGRPTIVEQGVALAGQSATERLAAVERTARTEVDTVVVYRDRVKTVYLKQPSGDGELLASASQTITALEQKISALEASAITRSSTEQMPSEASTTSLSATPSLLESLLSPETTRSTQAHTDLTTMLAQTMPTAPSTDNDPEAMAQEARSTNSAIDPNNLLGTENAESLAETKKPDADDPSDASASPALSLMADGFEIGYSERIGRVAPAPTADDVEPDFDARAVDFTWRALGGRTGLGMRLMYGSFAQITLDEQVWNGLGVADTIFTATLAPVTEAYAEVYANYRQPLFTERFALDIGGTFGLSSSRYKVGVDLTAIYLITDWLGAQAGVGYGSYWYTTQKLRQDALDSHENAGITDDLTDFYRGSMIEGRYGLFVRF